MLKALVIGALALSAAPALAEEGTMTLEFGALAVGSITTLSEGHVFWTGHFSGSAINTSGKGPVERAFVTCPGTNDLNFAANTSKLSGVCVLSDGADSRIIVEWTCTGTPGTCVDGKGTWSQGAGKWKDVKAEVTWTAQLGAALTDGTTPAYATWTVHYTTP